MKYMDREEIIYIVNSSISNNEKAEKIYRIIKNLEAKANNGYSKPGSLTIDNIMEYLVERDEFEAMNRR